MNWTRRSVRRWALAGLGLLVSPAAALAGAGDPPRPGMVDLGVSNPKLQGFQAPAGFKLELVADAKLLGPATALAFDDSGRLYLAETIAAGRSFDVYEAVTLPDGTKLRLHRHRKSTTDRIKRLTDTDGDGRFDQGEVVLEGLEQPTALLWTKEGLYVAASGRLERWDDGDGDDRYETRTILVDGFGGGESRGLTGLTLGPDGYLYLTTGDDETHAITPAGTRVDLPRSGGLFRCRPDGSDLTLLSLGYREPRGGIAFGAAMVPTLIDDDGADGSKLAGVRLIQPGEQGDYGWRTIPGHPAPPDPIIGDVLGNAQASSPGTLVSARRHRPTSSSTTVWPCPTLAED